jgi:hypothetical protein
MIKFAKSGGQQKIASNAQKQKDMIYNMENRMKNKPELT